MYLGIELFCSGLPDAMDPHEQVDGPLLVLIDVVQASQATAGNDFVNLVSQPLSYKREVARLLGKSQRKQ